MLGNDDGTLLDSDTCLNNWKEKRRVKRELSITLEEPVEKIKAKLAEKGGGSVGGVERERGILRTGGIKRKEERRWSVCGLQKNLEGKSGPEKGSAASNESELERVFRRRGSDIRDAQSLLYQPEQDVQLLQQRTRSVTTSSCYYDNNKKAEDDNSNDRVGDGGKGAGNDGGGGDGDNDEGQVCEDDNKNRDQNALRDPLHCQPDHHNKGDDHNKSNDNNNNLRPRNQQQQQPPHESSTGECLKQVSQTRVYGSGAKEEEKEKIGKIDKEKKEEKTEDISEVGKGKVSNSGSKRRENNDDVVIYKSERTRKGNGNSEESEEEECKGMSEKKKSKGEKEGEKRRMEKKIGEEGIGEDKSDGLSGLSEPCAAGDNPKASASCIDSNSPLVAAATAAAAATVGNKVTTQPSHAVATTTTATTSTTTSATTTTTVKTLTSTTAKSALPLPRRPSRPTTTTSTRHSATPQAVAAAVAAEVNSKFTKSWSSFSSSSSPLSSSSSSLSSSAVSGSSRVFQPVQKPQSSDETLDSSVQTLDSPSKLLVEAVLLPAATTTTANDPVSTSTSAGSASAAAASLPSFLSSSSSSSSLSSLTRPLRVTSSTSHLLPPALKPRLSLKNSEPQPHVDRNTAPALDPEPSQSQKVSPFTIPDISEEVIAEVNSCKNNNQLQTQHQESVLNHSETDSKETTIKTESPSDSGLDTGTKLNVSFNSGLDQVDHKQSNKHLEEYDIYPGNISTSILNPDVDLELNKNGSDISGTMKQVSNDKEMSESDFSAIRVTETLNSETARHKLLLRRKSSLAQRQRPRRLRKQLSESGSDTESNRNETPDSVIDNLSWSTHQIQNLQENEKFDNNSSIEKIPEKITDYLPKVSTKHGDPGLQLKREKNLENEAVFGTQSSVHSRNLYNNDSDNQIEPSNYTEKTSSKKTEKPLSYNRISETPEPLQPSQQSPEQFSPPPLLYPPPLSSPELFSSSPALPESVEPQVTLRRFRLSHLHKGLAKSNTDNSLDETVDKNWRSSLNELNTRITRKGKLNGNLTEPDKGPRILRTLSSIERQICRDLIKKETSKETDLSKTDNGSSVKDKSEDLLIEDYKSPKSISESNYSFDVKSVLRKVPPNAKENPPKDNSLATKEPLFKKNLETRQTKSFIHLERKPDNKVQKDPPWLKDFSSSGKKVGRIFSKFDCVKSPTEEECKKEQTPKNQETSQTRNNVNGAEINNTKQTSLFPSSSISTDDTNKTPGLSETKKPVIHKEQNKLSSSSFSTQRQNVDGNKTESKLIDRRLTISTYRNKNQQSDKVSQQRKSVSSTLNSSFSVSSISDAVPDWKKKLAEKNKTKRDSFQKVDDISQNKTEDTSTIQPAWRQNLANKNRNFQNIEQSEKNVAEKPEWIKKAEERRARLSQNNLLKK